MAMRNASHYASTTSTNSHFTGAYVPNNTSVTEPPRHTRPLYYHIPLPYEHVNLHPALDYNAHTPTSLLGPDIRYRSTPATSPPRACLTILLPSTRQRMTVCPSSSPTNTYCGIVTVWDVLIAVEMVMSRLDSTDDTCLQGFPSGDGSTVEGRRCVCKGHIPSLEYLRQRYGRAGLAKARGDGDVWMLYVGYQ
ncbi:hypothetical protein BDZ94DRAFT_1266618 [Collybia nuda]|uniref:Uncharacterized protein n=1 Tax=Collybia nuda TaxID=64659 RepID=A0A9P5Y0N6_9AGAR|nr:hypothetical protein BDZ94DRAFT_1266618 [Collybia nuda]